MSAAGDGYRVDLDQVFGPGQRLYSYDCVGWLVVAEQAQPELFGLRHLSVGKMAPDIEGQDQDGVGFKLSDYRGKVVLLDFWSEY